MTPKEVSDGIKQWKKTKVAMERMAPRMIERLLEVQSLRSLARDMELSPTYLSQVRNGNTPISPEVFLKIERRHRRRINSQKRADKRRKVS